MASSQGMLEFVRSQLPAELPLRSRKMFGEYALYLDAKVVAFICDDRLLVKPTPAGLAFIGKPLLGLPYPGAKPCYHIPDKQIQRGSWLAELLQLTAASLPQPKPKKKPAEKRKPGQ